MTTDSNNGSRRQARTGLMLQEIRDDFIVPLLAASGFDLTIVDMEHGSFSLREVAHLALLCRLHGITCLVRPPDHAYASIAPALDAGEQGIMLPRVAHPDQVRQALAAMKYPPVGERGMASQRAHTGYLPTPNRRRLAEDRNRDTTLIVQIELAEAIDRIDAILAVPGVDAGLVGPSDLSLSLNCEPGDETMKAAIDRVVEAGRRHGVTIGLQTGSLQQLEYWHAAGMGLLVAGTDLGLVTAAMRSCGDRLRAVVGGARLLTPVVSRQRGFSYMITMSLPSSLTSVPLHLRTGASAAVRNSQPDSAASMAAGTEAARRGAGDVRCPPG